MKGIISVKCGQYVYTVDGRIIRIESVNEDENKFRGLDVSGNEVLEIELEGKDIYGFLRRL